MLDRIRGSLRRYIQDANSDRAHEVAQSLLKLVNLPHIPQCEPPFNSLQEFIKFAEEREDIVTIMRHSIYGPAISIHFKRVMCVPVTWIFTHFRSQPNYINEEFMSTLFTFNHPWFEFGLPEYRNAFGDGDWVGAEVYCEVILDPENLEQLSVLDDPVAADGALFLLQKIEEEWPDKGMIAPAPGEED